VGGGGDFKDGTGRRDAVLRGLAVSLVSLGVGRGDAQALSVVPSVPAARVADALGRSDALVLDVRDAFEWEEGHLSGATHAPLRSLTQEFCGRVKREAGRATVLVVDLDGRRAARAQALLSSFGVRDVRILEGGMLGWARREGPDALRLVGQGGRVGHLAKFDYASFDKGCGWATRMVGGCGATNKHLARIEPRMEPMLLPKEERAKLGYGAVFEGGLDIPGT